MKAIDFYEQAIEMGFSSFGSGVSKKVILKPINKNIQDGTINAEFYSYLLHSRNDACLLKANMMVPTKKWTEREQLEKSELEEIANEMEYNLVRIDKLVRMGRIKWWLIKRRLRKKGLKYLDLIDFCPVCTLGIGVGTIAPTLEVAYTQMQGILGGLGYEIANSQNFS